MALFKETKPNLDIHFTVYYIVSHVDDGVSDTSCVHRWAFFVLPYCLKINFVFDSNCLKLYIFTNPSARVGYQTRSISKRSLTRLNSEFSFLKTSYLTKGEEPSLPYYLPIAGGRIIGFITIIYYIYKI